MQILKPYAEVKAAKYPETVDIVIAKTPDGHFNPMAASWVMFTSIEPPMLAVSIGVSRYTFELIKYQNEFVISIPSEKMATEVEFFGSNSGRDINKLAEMETPTQPASVIDGIILSEASANFECKLKSATMTGDHMIFAGEIVASHINQEHIQRLYVLGKKKFGSFRPEPEPEY